MVFFISRHCIFLTAPPLETALSCFVYPFLKIQQLIIEPIQMWLSRRVAMNELQRLYISLQKDYELLLAENIALKAINQHMHNINELSSFFKARYYHKNTMVITQVLARHLSDQSQFFLVNAGTSQGVKKDMIALYQNCLIGKVTQVYPWYCKVCLITDNDCKVAVVCSETGSEGIVEGINNTEIMSLKYISHLSTVKMNDLVLSSGEGLIFPSGFGLGKIIDVKKENLFYVINVKPMIDFRSLRYCILIAKEDIENDMV
jgi:rod shape-determining protein MreC